MSGAAVDINILAVKCVMDTFEVADQADCMDKVQNLAWTVLGEKAKRRKDEEK